MGSNTEKKQWTNLQNLDIDNDMDTQESAVDIITLEDYIGNFIYPILR